MSLQRVLDQRDDLGCFVIHLTRSSGARTALQNLASIIGTGKIRARKPFGIAQNKIAYLLGFYNGAHRIPGVSQHCVCFTEAPLRYIPQIAQQVDGRQNQFEPYGIAIPRARARRFQANWVWYIHDGSQLERHWQDQIAHALRRGGFDGAQMEQMTPEELAQEIQRLGDFMLDDSLFKLTPFLEACFTNQNGLKKEFWWEREWRYVGDFELLLLGYPSIVFCPLEHHEDIRAEIASSFLADPETIEEYGDELQARLETLQANLTLLDAGWNADEIRERFQQRYRWNFNRTNEFNIGRLANIEASELRPWA